MIGGQQLIITDTAGIRHSDDLVEKEGIDLARAEIQKANALIFVLDISKL
jgi:tRNA modification GTPase